MTQTQQNPDALAHSRAETSPPHSDSAKTFKRSSATRGDVLTEAQSWLGTPFHHEAKLKGVGVDCGQYLIQVFHNVGLIPLFETGHYPLDWALHSEQERYLNFVLQYARPLHRLPEPADIVLWRRGRSFSHGAITVAWPRIIHAQMGVGITYTDAEREEALLWRGHPSNQKPRERLFFTLWG